MDVCVTGGNGYIASCIIRALLAKGLRVRATVRNFDDKAKTGFLWELPGAMERLQIVRADLLEDGSFDMAVQGVHTVLHVACPVLMNPDDDPQVTILDPALEGSMNVLKACERTSSVKRVVMTSSASTIRYEYNRQKTDPPLNESNWSNPEYCRENKLWYSLAKTLAEREAFAFAARTGLDLVAVNPSCVVGPFLTTLPQSSVGVLLNLLKDIVNILQLKCPKLTVASRCSDRTGDDFPHKLDSTKIKRLGLVQLKSLDQMFDDLLQSFHEKGLIDDYA